MAARSASVRKIMGADVAISPHFPGLPRCPEGWLQTGRIGSPLPCGQVLPLGSRKRIAAPVIPWSNRLTKHRCLVQRSFRIAPRLAAQVLLDGLEPVSGMRLAPTADLAVLARPALTRHHPEEWAADPAVSRSFSSVSGRSLRSTRGSSHEFRVAATHRRLWITGISGMKPDYFWRDHDAASLARPYGRS